MINPTHILALSETRFVRGQVRNVLCAGAGDRRRSSFWRGWGFEQP